MAALPGVFPSSSILMTVFPCSARPKGFTLFISFYPIVLRSSSLSLTHLNLEALGDPLGLETLLVTLSARVAANIHEVCELFICLLQATRYPSSEDHKYSTSFSGLILPISSSRWKGTVKLYCRILQSLCGIKRPIISFGSNYCTFPNM